MDDEQEIRDLIHRWAAAVHAGDLDGVLAGHARDIVVFDVPPPERGVRGLEAYRRMWPDFFAWQASGAAFTIDELDVTAGGGVAYAVALLRCGTPAELAATPGLRLRLTLGLRREHGGWVVAHEHHSFPDDTDPGAAEAIRGILRTWSDATLRKDLDAVMCHIADDVVSFEQAGDLRYVGADAVREVCRQGLDAAAEVHLDTHDVTVVASGDLAVAWGVDHVRGVSPEGTAFDAWSRGTRVFARREQRWLMTHQHLSFPLATDEAGRR